MRGGTEGGGVKISGGMGVRAQLLAQKELHEQESLTSDSQSWLRHPLMRIAAIWAVWRRLWRS